MKKMKQKLYVGSKHEDQRNNQSNPSRNTKKDKSNIQQMIERSRISVSKILVMHEAATESDDISSYTFLISSSERFSCRPLTIDSSLSCSNGFGAGTKVEIINQFTGMMF